MSFDLRRATQVLLFFVLIFVILSYGKPFLVPVIFAALFAMLLLPIAKKLEPGTGKAGSVLLSILIVVAVVAGIFALLSWQVADIASDASKIEQEIKKKLATLSTQITEKLGISQEQQQKIVQKQQSSAGSISSYIGGALNSLAGIFTNALLVLVYIFLFMYFRTRLRNFILKLMPEGQKQEADKVMTESRKVAEQYLGGLALMIVCLWILYGIGFTIVGVKNALFFAILCGLLEIVPFVGNLIGTTLTAFMVLAQGGSGGMVLGVLATYAVVQTFQSYVLEPLIVGSNVNINPLFTILVLIFGEFLWGLPGMVLAIPVLGIVKIICDHVKALQPVGYLIGEYKNSDAAGKLKDKAKRFFKKRG